MPLIASHTGYVDAERFFGEGFPQRPWDSLTIISGGAIGAEFALIFFAFGTKVSVVEMLPRLVANEEEAVSDMENHPGPKLWMVLGIP